LLTYYTIFIGQTHAKNAFTIKIILRMFELCYSNLKVNFWKSSFGATRVEVGVVERYVNMLNSSVLAFPFTYIGLPIRGNPRRKEMWQLVIMKFSKKLAILKHKNMPYARRICLINHVLSSLPLFFIFSSLKCQKRSGSLLWGFKGDSYGGWWGKQ